MRAREGVQAGAVARQQAARDLILIPEARGHEYVLLDAVLVAHKDQVQRVKNIVEHLKGQERTEHLHHTKVYRPWGCYEGIDAGDRFQVVESIAMAREVALKRAALSRQTSLSSAPVHVTLENLLDRLGSQKTPTLNLILRADVRGSIEAIQKELTKLDHPEVKIRILQATVGGVTEADVQLADASDAIIIAFNVVPDERARSLADELGARTWCAGDHYTLADIAVGTALGYLDFRMADINWRKEYPNLAKLSEKLNKRASFADTVPPKS